MLAMVAAAAAGGAAAQQPVPAPAQSAIMIEEDDSAQPAQAPEPRRAAAQHSTPQLEVDPNLDVEDQLAPSQIRQPMPAAVAQPSGGDDRVHRRRAASRRPSGTAHAHAPAAVGRIRDVVACNGVFARDSSQPKLAAAFRSRNVASMQVDGASGNKVMATVLFAKDPKRRLEVWWSKPDSRSGIHLIVIGGRSNWTAPGGLRLGLPLTDLERLNGKPFKTLGFDTNQAATLTDWNGGTLAAVSGGCKIGLSLRPGLTASAVAIRGLPADRQFSSTEPAMRALNPTVSEILIAY
jgi:hypothetical protein